MGLNFLQGLFPVLACLIMGAVSFFLWQRRKAQPAFLMMVGFGAAFLGWFVLWVFAPFDGRLWFWLFTAGLLVAAAGFFLTFRTEIQEQLDAFKAKAEAKIHGGKEKEEGEGGE